MSIISRTVAIWDIDTTIANNNHRAALLTKICRKCKVEVTDHSHRSKCQACGSDKYDTPQACWDAFLKPELLMLDTPEPDAQRVIAHMRDVGMELHFLTGRNEGLREPTEAWLKKHFNWDSHSRERVYMRYQHEKGIPASVMKEELLLKLVKEQRLNLDIDNFLFFEDDTHVFDMYCKYGIVIRCPEALKHFCPPGEDRSTEPAWKR